jgi:hypothetical protein
VTAACHALLVAKTDAERQRESRERRRLERKREAIRELVGEECACCGVTHAQFLVRIPQGVYCRNCAEVVGEGWLCPHQGVSRHLR